MTEPGPAPFWLEHLDDAKRAELAATRGEYFGFQPRTAYIVRCYNPNLTDPYHLGVGMTEGEARFAPLLPNFDPDEAWERGRNLWEIMNETGLVRRTPADDVHLVEPVQGWEAAGFPTAKERQKISEWFIYQLYREGEQPPRDEEPLWAGRIASAGSVYASSGAPPLQASAMMNALTPEAAPRKRAAASA